MQKVERGRRKRKEIMQKDNRQSIGIGGRVNVEI